ncbi:terminase gpP N-terminus-related DNA-binding protein [Mesobacillus sp. S13]|uniref:terminase gpP N-terminus-related DNA-binding protein n=1 Tax=Mesobacillus sp. S13 TaxID=2880221 RepID=UPI001CF42AFD|nr:hypothetical protein [Mesobacillus sp. S13]
MLTEREMKAIKLYFEGRMTVDQIAKECGWENRSSVYKLLNREEAQNYKNMLEAETVKEALTMLRMNSKRLTKKLIDIADGNIENVKTVYAELNATNSGLEKAGLTAKNTIVLEDGKKSSDEDYNELVDMLKQQKEENS